jgi:hypothetical protein
MKGKTGLSILSCTRVIQISEDDLNKAFIPIPAWVMMWTGQNSKKFCHANSACSCQAAHITMKA